MKYNYYALAVGGRPGVYKTWFECQKYIVKGEKALFKGFVDLEEAKQFVHLYESPSERLSEMIEELCRKRPEITRAHFYGHIFDLDQLSPPQQNRIFNALLTRNFTDESRIAGNLYYLIKHESSAPAPSLSPSPSLSTPSISSSPSPSPSSSASTSSSTSTYHDVPLPTPNNHNILLPTSVPSTPEQPLSTTSSPPSPSLVSLVFGAPAVPSSPPPIPPNETTQTQAIKEFVQQAFKGIEIPNTSLPSTPGAQPTLGPTLQPVSPTHTQSTQTVPPVTKPSMKDYFSSILYVHVSESGQYDSVTLQTKMELTSRAIRIAQSTLSIPSTHFVQVSFHETPMEKIKKILNDGITLDGQLYMFAGYTNSGVGQNQAYFIRQSEKIPTPSVLWDLLGDFTEVSCYGPGKLGSRIGLSFAGSIKTIEIEEGEYIVEDDLVAKDGTLLTDGCGGISMEKLRQISAVLGISDLPIAQQLRALGFKGVLALDPTLPRGKAHYRFTKSMEKFVGNPNYRFIDVLQWSGQVSGKLTKQVMQCLLARKVPPSFFQRIFDKQYSIVVNALTSNKAALEFLKLRGKSEYNAQENRMLRAGFNPQNEPYLNKLLVKSLDTYISPFLSLKPKPYLKYRNIRYCIGIPDPTGELPPGTMYYESDETYTSTGLVLRHPCYTDGDMLKVQFVDCAALHDWKNVLVISTHADNETSLANKMGGGDFDGDWYLICLDSTLVSLVSPNVPPFSYQDLPKSKKREQIPVEERSEQIIKHYCKVQENKSVMGRLDTCISAWADLSEEGIGSEECKKLVPHLQIALDSSKSGIFQDFPTALAPPNSAIPHYLKGPRHSTTIFGYMYDKMAHARTLILSNNNNSNNNYPSFQLDPHLVMSTRDQEYESLLMLAKQHYRMYNYEMALILKKYELRDEKQSKSFKELNNLKFFKHSSEKSYEVELLVQRIKRQIFSGLPDSAYLTMARAMYEVVYQSAIEKSTTTNQFNNNTNSSEPTKIQTFAWNIAVELLCRIKADAVTKERNGDDLVSWSVINENVN